MSDHSDEDIFNALIAFSSLQPVFSASIFNVSDASLKQISKQKHMQSVNRQVYLADWDEGSI